ncbi:hypothetical protein BH18ACI2_BH18ACI2_16370 [soil metagenome]
MRQPEQLSCYYKIEENKDRTALPDIPSDLASETHAL